MKTTLIDGAQAATIDASLFIEIELVPAEPQLVWTESILIGTVKTTLIDGAQAATIDASLFIEIELVPAEPQLVWTESILIGIRNECGEIYRAIGVTGMSTFVNVAAKLRELGYRDETLGEREAEQGFDAILRAPDAC